MFVQLMLETKQSCQTIHTFPQTSYVNVKRSNTGLKTFYIDFKSQKKVWTNNVNVFINYQN